MSLLLLIGLAVAVTLDVSIILGRSGSSSGAMLTWGSFVGALCVASFVKPLRNLRQEQERRRADELFTPVAFPARRGGRRPVARG